MPGTSVVVEQLDLCPPMEDTGTAHRMLAHARSLGAELGLGLGATATGGVGDANIIAGVGVPVLDGLGPVGGADHSPEEWLDTTSVPARSPCWRRSSPRWATPATGDAPAPPPLTGTRYGATARPLSTTPPARSSPLHHVLPEVPCAPRSAPDAPP
ncbi:hypothetical protein LUR56_00175 [Streptomyces sp. MT29]|nr:hypothetical protein [Streptomyces sp. MT29]